MGTKKFVALTQNQKLSNQWHPTKNKHLTPQTTHLHSDEPVWWLFKRTNPITAEEEIYEWQESPASRNMKKEKFPADLKPIILNPKEIKETEENREEIAEKNKLSPMAAMVYDILKQNGIKFEIEHSFDDMPYEVPLPYDFFIDKDCLIEIDGPHHFTPFHQNKKVSSFEKRIRIDNLKNDYCIKKNLPLLRVPNMFNPDKDKEKIQLIILTFVKTKEIPNEIKNIYSLYGFSNYMKEKSFNTEGRKEIKTESMNMFEEIINQYARKENPYNQVVVSYERNEISYDMAIGFLADNADGSREWLDAAERIKKIKEDRKMKYYACLYAGKNKRKITEKASELQKLRELIAEKEAEFSEIKKEMDIFSF